MNKEEIIDEVWRQIPRLERVSQMHNVYTSGRRGGQVELMKRIIREMAEGIEDENAKPVLIISNESKRIAYLDISDVCNIVAIEDINMLAGYEAPILIDTAAIIPMFEEGYKVKKRLEYLRGQWKSVDNMSTNDSEYSRAEFERDRMGEIGWSNE